MRTTAPGTVADMLVRNGRYFADEPAFVFGKRKLSHHELLARGTKLAGAFYAAGLRRQERVSILATNCLEYCEAYAAAELSAYVAVTINYRLAAAEVLATIKDAAPKILIFEARYADLVGQIRGQISTVERYVCIGDSPYWAVTYEAFIELGGTDDAPYEPVPSDLCYIIYTSGSTGRPKGVMISQGGAIASAEMIALATQPSPSDKCLLMMPFFHVGAKNMQLAMHKQACTVHVLPGFDAEEVLRQISDNGISITHMAPSLIKQCLEHPLFSKYDLRSLDTVCYSAAPMPLPQLQRGLKVLGPVFVQLYGQTEGAGTVLPAHLHRPRGSKRDLRRLESIGFPGHNVEARVVNDDDIDVPVGEPGELILRSPTVMSGYWNNSAATAEALRGGWLHTGDMAKYDEDGFLYLVDRKKDMIITGGENVYSREVEIALCAHPAVQDAAVIGLADEQWGEIVCAIVVPHEGKAISNEELIAYSRASIAGYKKPRRIIIADTLPRLPTGKVDKVALRNIYQKNNSL